MFKPRFMQAEILRYQSGKMGIAAVPGSGKTHTLSALAAQLITRNLISDDQEILVVTLVNSAVGNFSKRITAFIQESGLLVNLGYRVRTLHGLAHDIVKERPDLAGLSDQFSILDESETSRMIEQISAAYLRNHPELEIQFVDPSVELRSNYQAQKGWNSTVTSINTNFISQAKDYRIEPKELREKVKKYELDDPLLNMGIEVYQEYQRGLMFRGAVDFADLIRLAFRVLESDVDFLKRLQHRWPYILEDEAQDSSETQEKILRMLAGPSGNWVRVGDTNQAIYETFTTASPDYLRNFLIEKDVIEKDLANSGRSNLSIINLANFLNTWSRESHPIIELRKSLSTPLIIPAPPDDPQPNPADHPQAIFISRSASSFDQEVHKVVSSVKSWLPNHQDKTVAILCPTTYQAEKVVETLQNTGIKIVEMLKSTQSTRQVTKLLEGILRSLANPSSASKLAAVFALMMQNDPLLKDHKKETRLLVGEMMKLERIEDFLYPIEETHIYNSSIGINAPEVLSDALQRFKTNFIRWQNATTLPIDQLLLTIGKDLYQTPQDLALTHKLALLLEFCAKNHPDYQLSQFALELAEIATNDRSFSGFSEDDCGFQPESHRGEIVISTYHKAKGLEWDRVYLLSVNNYDFPSAQIFDPYKGEKWFINHQFNLGAELLSLLKAIIRDDIQAIFAEKGDATQKDRIKYASERLRLLYVGITRARESLIITWNTGRKKEARMALPLEALYAFWEQTHATS
ncbi:MAG: ATP-dependent helicase [Chloroflexi bacterium]|nr:ATP-dependent helicase [Chloroflexota bacterium]